MSSLRRRFSNRGTSVLAALVMVAILSVAGYAFEQVRNQYVENTQQLAAAAAAGSDYSTSQNSQPSGIDRQCQPGYVNKVAIVSGKVTGPVDDPIQCWTKDSKGNPVVVPNRPDDCRDLPATECRVEACVQGSFTKSGDSECETVGEYLPGDPQYAKLQQSGDMTVWTQAMQQQGNLDSLANLKQDLQPAQASALNDAFSSAEAPIKTSLDDISQTRAGIADQLANLSSQCGASESVAMDGVPSYSSACDQYSQLKAQDADLAAQQKTLQDQMSALQGAQQQSGAPVAGGDQTCNVVGVEGGVGCDNQANPKEFYVAPEEVDSMKEAGYSCGAVDSSSGVATCTKTQTGPGTKTPNCPTCGQQTFTPPNTKTPANTSGGAGNLGGLTSFLSGLARGLAQSAATAPQMACTSDQNTYNQQLQQYQYQLQQYQYQLQLYNQQRQLAQYNGNYVAPLPPTQPSQPCYNPNAACTAQQPQQPDPSQCSVGSWKPLYSGQCIVNWQCVPQSGNGQQPTAQLSCNPSIADVGMSVAVAYSCTNATQSRGSGFDTGGAVSGTTTVTVAAPPQGANTATYGLTCANGTLTSAAQCSVQISQPSIVLVANPQTVNKGDTTTIGWVTSGMQACTISSPDQPDFTAENANNTSVNGVASSSPITATTEFVLDCETLGGGTRTATTTVSYPGAPSSGQSLSSITVSSDKDGGTANHGDSVNITWSTDAPPSGTAISLWLIDMRSGNTVGLISGGQPTSGSYTWRIPATTDTCDNNSPAPCAGDLVPGRSYGIEAGLYSPQNAFLGGLPVPANAVDPTYVDYETTQPFTIGQ